jgi:NAD(P)-dependent dehydrogenase (short-subunit alcohol dehydrogenase family)
LELVEHNITVNAYAPGIVQTRMTVSEYDKDFGGEPCAAAKHVSYAQAVLKIHIDQRCYIQSFGLPNAPVAQPEDIANTVSFLVSSGAQFITGEVHSDLIP